MVCGSILATTNLRMWYMGADNTLYATSRDGINWEKPSLVIKPGKISCKWLGGTPPPCGWIPWRRPQKRFKFIYNVGTLKSLVLRYSPDGIHWGDVIAQSPAVGDRTTFFWNPFRGVWVFSLRDYRTDIGRFRQYRESSDLKSGIHWKEGEPVPWVSADRLDPPDPAIKLPRSYTTWMRLPTRASCSPFQHMARYGRQIHQASSET